MGKGWTLASCFQQGWCLPSPANQMIVETMGKGWTLASCFQQGWCLPSPANQMIVETMGKGWTLASCFQQGWCLPSPANQMIVETMGKGWTLASHSWSNTTTRPWAGLAGLITTSTGSALSFVQSNVRGPSLHLLLGLLHLASLATDSRREHLTGPMIISPSATRLKERSSPVVLVYYPRDVLNRFCWIIAHGSWTNPFWQAGPPRSALAHPAIVCLSQHGNKTQRYCKCNVGIYGRCFIMFYTKWTTV